MTDDDSGEINAPDPDDEDGHEADPQDESSIEWLQQFAEGDEAAFERLLAEELPKLRRRVEDRLGVDLRRRIDPSDVMQQAALDVHQLRDGFENRGLPQFRAWLRTVTFNNLNRLIEKELAQKRDPRREKRRAMEAGASRSLDPLGNLAASISSPSAGMHRQEALNLLENCLDLLGDEDRDLLRWIDEEDLGYPEVARRLSLNVDATRRRHSRAIARLRKLAETMRGDAAGQEGPPEQES